MDDVTPGPVNPPGAALSAVSSQRNSVAPAAPAVSTIASPPYQALFAASPAACAAARTMASPSRT